MRNYDNIGIPYKLGVGDITNIIPIESGSTITIVNTAVSAHGVSNYSCRPKLYI